MKHLLAAAMGFCLLGGSAAMAQSYPPGPGYGHPQGPPGYGHPPGSPGYGPSNGGGHWHNGGYYNGHRNIADWRAHHLRRPPNGYEWVQDRNQFVLIAIGNGVIIDIR